MKFLYFKAFKNINISSLKKFFAVFLGWSIFLEFPLCNQAYKTCYIRNQYDQLKPKPATHQINKYIQLEA